MKHSIGQICFISGFIQFRIGRVCTVSLVIWFQEIWMVCPTSQGKNKFEIYF